MNSLNSILIEGILENNPRIEKRGNEIVFHFVIWYMYIKEVENDIVKKKFTIDVEILKRDKTEKVEFLKKGSAVRIVGTLLQDELLNNYILASCIDIKPRLLFGGSNET